MTTISGNRTRIPIRDTAREMASTGSGPVTSWQMSPEELEDYRARTGYKTPKHPDGHAVSQPVQHGANRKREEAKNDMSKAGPDKQKFLELIAAGESITAAEKTLGLKANGIYYWLKKWDLIGIDPGKARELLGIEEKTHAEAMAPDAQIVQRLTEELNGKNKRLAEVEQHAKEQQTRIRELTEDRDNWKQIAEQRKEEIGELSQFLTEANETIRSGQAFVSKVELIPNLLSTVDNVNSPAHYTQGGIETIDFIHAKLTPEEFAGYCKGNALKYVSRATHKGGVEDLRKAGVYLGWAVGGER
jgi:hypothetical protein